MIVNLSARSITLLLAVGVATSTTGSNLRQQQRRRTTLFGHSHHDETKTAAASSSATATVVTKQSTNLRGAPTDTSDDYAKTAAVEEPVAAAAAAPKESASTLSESTSISSEPSLTLTKSTFSESESITLLLSVGSPSHPYYSSSSVPTLNLDYNYAEWSVGLFMRDADPQGGTLSPIVSVNLCGALGEACDATQKDWRMYGDVSVTFGDENLALMHGKWPLHVSEYGTGFDAYVLDGKGAGAIGPLEFYIQDAAGDYDSYVENVQPAHYGPKSEEHTSSSSSSSVVSPGHASTKKSGLAKYSKGTKKASERQHTQVSKATHTNTAVKVNTKIEESNGVELSSNTVPASTVSEESEFAAMEMQQNQGPSKDSISSNKSEYESDDEVSINFNIDTTSHSDLSNYKIGIFMRMAHPQGGALDPVVSLPISTMHASSSIPGVASGSVTFGPDAMDKLLIGTWPIDLYQWGTGFDAYVLDERGEDVVGPVKFNIMMNDTY